VWAFLGFREKPGQPIRSRCTATTCRGLVHIAFAVILLIIGSDHPDDLQTQERRRQRAPGGPWRAGSGGGVHVSELQVLHANEPGTSPRGVRSLSTCTPPTSSTSFWIPQLGGKRDVVPHRTTAFTLTRRPPGVPGQCAEYCGMSHCQTCAPRDRALEGELRAVGGEQRKPPAEPTDELGKKGQELFAQSACVGCHRSARLGRRHRPRPEHFGSRRPSGEPDRRNAREPGEVVESDAHEAGPAHATRYAG